MIFRRKWSEMTTDEKLQAIVLVPFILVMGAISAVVVVFAAASSAKTRQADDHLPQRNTLRPRRSTHINAAPRVIRHPRG